MSAHENQLPATRANVERAEFIRTGSPPASVRPEVAASWRRSTSWPRDRHTDRPAQADVRPRTDVVDLARRVLGLAGAQEGPADVLVVVVDVDGAVVGHHASPSCRVEVDRLGLRVGDALTEGVIGTTAVALALASGAAHQVVGAEHLLPQLICWTTTAIPVRGADGVALGLVAAFERTVEQVVTQAWLQLIVALLEVELRRA